MDVVCPRCGASIPAHARFCMSCGTPLDAAAAPVEERRLVSILFADLVGFTARSDEADPEDVRRTLVPFHERAKDAIERFGGTLDKFIGDAAMGVFGAPVAHGDDAERAVRAGLDLLGSMRELSEADPDVAVRVAVNTGEAVVAFGEGPQVGEAVAGDVVNTASRMQAVAPARRARDRRGDVALGPRTLRDRGTGRRQRQGEGGTDPDLAGGGRASHDGAGGGRAAGRAAARARHARGTLRLAEARRVPEAVTIVADPGVGKTRLTQEFRRELGPDVPWFAGACLPYGDGVTFRALVDVVRAAAGIDRGAEGDVARIAVGSLADRVAVDPSDRAWLARAAGAAAGRLVRRRREGERPDASARESAAACARILAHAAADGPIVVELEDLHWAEAGLLEAIEHLVRGLEGTPALVLCTARPEFAERADGWGGDTIRLSELTADETRALLHELLRRDEVAGRGRRRVARASRREPAVRARVRADAERRRTRPRVRRRAHLGARCDRGAARRHPRRASSAAAGRIGRGHGVLAGSAGRARDRARCRRGRRARAGPPRHGDGAPLLAVAGAAGVRVHACADP